MKVSGVAPPPIEEEPEDEEKDPEEDEVEEELEPETPSKIEITYSIERIN